MTPSPQLGPMNDVDTSSAPTPYVVARACETWRVSASDICSVCTRTELPPTVATLVVAPGTTVWTASVAFSWSGASRPETVNCDPPVNSIENCGGRMKSTRMDATTRPIAIPNHTRRRRTKGTEVLPV